jgi:AcrR family transcriptional regulator
VIGRPREFDIDRALERAMELFWRQGYEGTSLTDLTRELGLTRPSLYAAFESKEGLFLKALDLYEARAGYRQAALKAPTAAAYARALLEGAADLHETKETRRDAWESRVLSLVRRSRIRSVRSSFGAAKSARASFWID